MIEDKNNPVLYEHEGFEIKKSNKITITLSDSEYVRAINAHVQSGRILSIPKIISLQGTSCQQCGCDNITLLIPRNVLSSKKIGSGGSISSYKKDSNGQGS